MWDKPCGRHRKEGQQATKNAGLRAEAFPFDADLSVTIGGDMMPVSKPTGLHAPRINLADKRATGAVFVSTKDALGHPAPGVFLRKVMHDALSEVFDRLGKVRVALDRAQADAQIACLKG